MEKKAKLFLFACMLGLGSSMALADAGSCTQTCLIKYDDCLSKPWLSQGYCSSSFQSCLAACDGTLPGQ